MASDGTIKISTELDTKQAAQEMSQFSGEAQKGFSNVKKVATVAASAIAAAAAAATAAVVKLGSEFNEQMKIVQSISGATAEELDSLAEKAKYMGSTTQFTAKEAGQAMEYMAMAGWKTKDMISGLDGVMYAAGASGESLASVADIITDGITAFGLSANDSSRFADVLAAAASNANTNIGMMGETFKYVAPVAGAMGYSIEDSAVSIGLMANSGIKASQAGTSLRQILLGLQGGAEITGEAFGTARIEVENADGTMRNLNDVVLELRTAFGQMTEAEKAQNAEMIAGKIGMSGLLAIVNAGESDFNKLTAAIANSTGTAQKMNEVRLDNLQGDITILDSTLQGLGIQIYDSFDSPFREAAQGAIKAVSSVSKELGRPETKKSLDNIGDGMANLAVSATKLATKAIPPLISVADKAISTFDVWAPSIIAVTTAMGAVKGINTFMTASEAARKVILTAHEATKEMNVILGKKAAAEALDAAATKANMTVNSSGQLVTKAGAIATAEETATVLASTGAISMKTLAVGVLSGNIGVVTAAQMLWNAAMTANPIGLLIAGLAAAVTGIAVASKALKKESEAAKKTKETVTELAEEHEKLKDSISSAKNAFEDNKKAIETNASVAESLIKNIEKLADAENRNKGETKLLKGWIDELNSVMPELNIYYDEQTGKVEGLTDAVYSRIESIKEEAQAEAQREYITELYRQQAEAQMELEVSQYKLKEAIKEYGEDAYSTYLNATDTQKRYSASTKELEEIFGPLIEQEKAQADTLNQLNGDVENYRAVYEQTMNTVVEKSAEADAANGEYAESVKQLTEEQASVLSSLQGEYENLAESAANMFDKISGKSKVSVDEMLENLKYNQETVSQWADNIALLADKGLDSGLLEELRQAGPESAALVQEIVNAGEDKWNELSEQYAAAGEASKKAFATSMSVTDEVTQSVSAMAEAAHMALVNSVDNAGFTEIGENISKGYAEGVTAGIPSTEEATTEMAQKSTEAAKSELGISSPSKAFAQIGSYVAEGFANGVTENEQLATGATKHIAQTAKIESESEVNALNFPYIGEMMASGIANGIRTGKSGVVSAMVDAIKEAESAAKKAADIHSPSKLFRDQIGANIILGVARGVEENTGEATRALKDSVISMIKGADSHAIISDFERVMLDRQQSYSPTVQMSNAISRAADGGDSYDVEAGIDYGKLGNAVKKALNGVKVVMDGRTTGEVLTPYMDRNLGELEKRKERG